MAFYKAQFQLFKRRMIHSKIKKGKTSELLVQFSKSSQQWPSVIQRFYQTCKQQNVRINKSPSIKPQIIRLYTVQQNTSGLFGLNLNEQAVNLERFLKSNISQIELKFTIIYMNEQNYPIPDYQGQFVTRQNLFPRVLLLRQALENFYDLNYQVQTTLSEKQSIIYLCDLSAMIINCKNQGQIQLYDQKKQKMIRKGNQGQMTQMEVIWRNILFQTPGVGKDKCKAIGDKYPTYKSIIKDCEKDKQLKYLPVERGVKSSKIGSAIAQRIYKVFGSLNGKQTLY